MTIEDQDKILNAGFTLIKPMNYPRPGGKSARFEINQKTPERRKWHEMGWNYQSADERDKDIQMKLKNKKTILIDRRDENEIITDFLVWTTAHVDSTWSMEFLEWIPEYLVSEDKQQITLMELNLKHET